jgi:hypothetical protein
VPAPNDWELALDIANQLILENRSVLANSHRRLLSELNQARDKLSAIRLDAIETGTSPFSPREDFTRELVVDLIVSQIPFSTALLLAGSKSLSIASYLVRAAGPRLPISRKAAAGVLGFPSQLEGWATKLPEYWSSPTSWGSAAAARIGTESTENAFKAIAREVVGSAIDGREEGAPTGQFAARFLGGVENAINDVASIDERGLDAIADLLRGLRLSYNRYSDPALRGALRSMSTPTSVEGEYANPREMAADALKDFRVDRDSPAKLPRSRLKLADLIELDLVYVRRAINARRMSLSEKLVTVALAVTYPFHLIKKAEVPAIPFDRPFPEPGSVLGEEYLEVDDAMWWAIFGAIGGRARVSEGRTIPLSEALGKLRQTVINLSARPATTPIAG